MTNKATEKKALTGEGITDVDFIEEEIPETYVRLKGVFHANGVDFEEMVEWGDATALFAEIVRDKSNTGPTVYLGSNRMSCLQTKRGPMTVSPSSFLYLRVLANEVVAKKFQEDVNRVLDAGRSCATVAP